MNTTEQDTIRRRVAQDYARAVSNEDGFGCCGTEGGGCCAPAAEAAPQQKGVAVRSAGYTTDELGTLPADAVVNSFGCGNPTAYTDVKEGDVVLDLGSGAGIDILLAARKVGPTGRAIGIDMTDEMIAKAEANIDASGLTNVEVRKGIIEDMPVEDGSVDWVISNCVINLSPDKPAVFREIARVLKPGGRMLVSDIVVQDLPAIVRENRALYSGCVGGAISEEDYVQGLRDAGLTDVEVLGRHVYEATQIQSFLSTELASGDSSCCEGDCNSRLTADRAKFIADKMAGNVWSATISARR